MKPRRLSLFLPRANDFYRGVLAQMQRGFELCGVEVQGHCGLLDHDELERWCSLQRPDVVFEMNRSRAEIPWLPREIAHVCWLVDFNGRSLDSFEGSDITYLWAPAWLERYSGRGFHRWLGPGACDVAYAPRRADFCADVTFVGHIPKPWSPAELERRLVDGPGAPMTFADILEPIQAKLRARTDSLVSAEEYLAFVDAICAERSGQRAQLDATLRYDISGRLVRMLNRSRLIDAALESSAALRLYGPENWCLWPKYAPHYAGSLGEPAQMHDVYSSSRINLHEGTGVHWRSMDILSSGGLLFYLSGPEDALPGGINSQFEPDVHYVPFTLDNLPTRITELLADPERAASLRRNAAALVAREHTWRHRAAEVLADLQKILGR